MQLGKIMIILFILFLMACNGETIETNMSEKMPDFAFINQDHEILALENLEGDWWLASFIYTNCTIACPMMTANLAKIQSTLQEDQINIRIISFSIDPANDSPDVLKNYAEGYGADFEHWSLLTGYDFSTIKDISINTFRTNLQEGSPENPNNLTSHGTNFFLISPEGKIIKKYDGMGSDSIHHVIEDLRKVL